MEKLCRWVCGAGPDHRYGPADTIVVIDDKATVRRSDGKKLLPNEVWTDNAYYGSRVTYFADVTGDGRADAIVVND